MIRMNQAQRVQATTLRVSGARSRLLRQIALHQRQRILLVSAVNHAQRSGCRQLRPVRRSRQPLQVVAQELIAGRAAVHERIRDDGRRVADRHANGLLGGAQYLQVGMVAADQELQLNVDADLAGQNIDQLLDVLLVRLFAAGQAVDGSLDLRRGGRLRSSGGGLCIHQQRRTGVTVLGSFGGRRSGGGQTLTLRAGSGGRRIDDRHRCLLGRRLGFAGSALRLVGGRQRRRQRRRRAQRLQHLREELLGGRLVQIERNLVGHQNVVLIGGGQAVQDLRHGQRILEEDQALHHVHVVGHGQASVQADQAAQHSVAESAILDQTHRHLEGVRQHAVNVLGAEDGLLEDVHAARLQRNAERVLVLAIVQTALQHAVDDRLQARIDGLRFVGRLDDGDALLDVEVNALGDDGVDVLVVRVHVEQLVGAQRIGERILVRAEVVEDLAGDQRGQLVLAKHLVLVEHFAVRARNC